ncbi:rhodanese-like domain-containing protein [Aquibacillus kalidii]|uniref:rhodanese-like domain-containing protein n=1 Tax=Aquibacillus kalidii TaxID=2762597 RepID=UPI0016440F3D|nr:rhodanese-like domain-containing protein [Aquibacillus kalidii]
MGERSKVIIDVRDRVQYEKEHIPGSKSIPLDELSDKLSELDRKSDIQIVCNHGGQRSEKALHYLKKAHFRNVEIIEGGIYEWSKTNHTNRCTNENN